MGRHNRTSQKVGKTIKIWFGVIMQSKLPTEYIVPEEFKNDLGKLTNALSDFYTSARIARMENILLKRSRQVLTVFENTHHGHNISAILRTIDSFGFLDLFFLYSNRDMRFRSADTVDRGASQWLMPRALLSISQCASILKKSNYKIALVTLPDFSRTSENYLESIPSFSSQMFASDDFKNFVGQQKIALIFGSELHGVSPEWNQFADMYVSVNMYGFSESLNVSVCAAIILQSLRESLQSYQKNFFLNEIEKSLIFESWIAKNYASAYSYLAKRKPELINWYEFIVAGKFFQPN